MSFTGPRTDAASATLVIDGAESLATRRTAGGLQAGIAATAETAAVGRGGPPKATNRAGGDRGLQGRTGHDFSGDRRVAGAVEATASWLLSRQAADGHWRGPLEGDTILESEYILILAWAGRLRGDEIPGAARRILAEQLPTGGWAIHPGGPVDVSASVKAYLALKVTGHDPNSEPLQRARGAIERAGGPWAVNSFTRFYLALLGQMPYDACPAVPPEMVLLPDWFPINLHRVSAWSRTMIVPLSLIWAFKPVRQLPPSHGLEELFAGPAAGRGPVVAGGNGWWDRFFRGVDRLVKASDRIGIRPLRRRAVAACRRWMLDRFDGSDGLGAIFPPIVWSIVALKAMGLEDETPEVAECWRQLARLVEREPGGITRLEPCRSPVWDTAISLRGLCDAVTTPGVAKACGTRRGMTSGSAVGASLAHAVDWLLDREIRDAGDWSHAAANVAPSGWCFQYANRFYPDVDDTAMVLIALAVWRDSPASRGDSGRRERVEAAIGRAVPWLESMQSSDGGWGAFDRDNNLELLCKVPFADHNAMIDPSSPDLAGRVLEAFGRLGMRPGRPSVDRGIAYLRASQEADGRWFGRWGVNYVYGTWQAIEGLRAVGLPVGDAAVQSGADWLIRHQQACGGWGETPESYANPALAGRGTPTPSQTAWAVAGLVSAGRQDDWATRRGVQWLVERQQADGAWEETAFTGTGFPKVFYLRYHFYRIYFPLMALARFAQAASRAAGPREMVA